MKDIIEDAAASCAANVDGLFDERRPLTETADKALSGAVEKLKARLRLVEGEIARRAAGR